MNKTAAKKVAAKKTPVAKVTNRWGEVVKLDRKTTGPIVFHFRPNKYMRVNEAHLKEWEKLFAAYVGVPPNRAHFKELYEWSGDPGETISGSNNGWDECDYW
jgi:hypothetical protein